MKSLIQWIGWQEVPKSEWGKPAKIPFCFKTSRKIDGQDPANWTTYAEAKALNKNVGFVLTKDDPYFCIDLDNAFVDGAWSKHIDRILSWFPGAYVEVSHSGKGLHIFGKCIGGFPEHRKKIKFGNDEVELYTSGRFIAFSEQGTSGKYNTDLTKNLHEFIRVVMPPDESTVTGGVERYGGYLIRDREWLGPDDDDELIKRMLTSNPSPESVITGKATINDLWTANEKVLAESYPDGEGGYDSSSADAALFAHLAWWTGKDGPRMERIARSSALMRTKWDDHRNYLSGPRYTIHNACDRCNSVYRDPKQVEKLETDDSNSRIGPQLMDMDAQINHFKYCVYIVDRNRIFTPENEKIKGSGGILDRERFNAVYGGFIFALSRVGKSTTKQAFEAFILSQGHRFPRANTSCFKPQYKLGEIIKIDGLACVNTFIPANVEIGTGLVGVDDFLLLLRALFPDKDVYERYLCFIAAIVQYPGIKFKWCWIIQGVEGNGKSTIAKCVAYAVGRKYVFKPQAADLGNKFNSSFREKLFIQVEEIDTVNKREAFEVLKTMITEDWIAYQAKGIDTIMGDNVSNWNMTTNDPYAALITLDGRRYAYHKCPQQEKWHLLRDGLDGPFFNRIYDKLDNKGGLANVAGYLMRYPIPDHLNPAKLCQRAPETTSTAEAIENTQSAAHGEIREAIGQELPGFCGGWVSSYSVTELLESKNLARYFPLKKRRGIMKDLGYVPAPWMANGRASKKIPSEGNIQPILYVLENMSYGDVLSTEDYIKAQSPLDPVPMGQQTPVTQVEK